jgi:hypothetical protein
MNGDKDKNNRELTPEEEAYLTGCIPKEPNCTAIKPYYYENLSNADDTNKGSIKKKDEA